MAASDHMNDQLKMFMSPREVAGYVTEYGDFGRNTGELPHEVMRENCPVRHAAKTRNLADSGMGASVAAEGVKKPLDIIHSSRSSDTMLNNGHHRLLAQSQADPDRLMPVIHTAGDDNMYWGRDSRGMRREGLAYEAFNMHRSQDEDPSGVKR